jgi:hypothetical protein
MGGTCSRHGRDEKPEGKRPLGRWEDNIIGLRSYRMRGCGLNSSD